MPAALELELSNEKRQRLEEMRTRGDKAYLRERAAALLKIADGMSARQVALNGLLQERKPRTVRNWYHRYLDEGLEGLEIREGRGRKPAFPPGDE